MSFGEVTVRIPLEKQYRKGKAREDTDKAGNNYGSFLPYLPGY